MWSVLVWTMKKFITDYTTKLFHLSFTASLMVGLLPKLDTLMFFLLVLNNYKKFYFYFYYYYDWTQSYSRELITTLWSAIVTIGNKHKNPFNPLCTAIRIWHTVFSFLKTLLLGSQHNKFLFKNLVHIFLDNIYKMKVVAFN